MLTMIDNARAKARLDGGPAWWFGLLAALGGLVVCLRFPWASDVLVGGWQRDGRRPPANASGSVEAFATKGGLGGGWPADALHAAVAVRDVWAAALVIGLVVALVRLLRGPWTSSRGTSALRLLAAVPLVAAPLAAAVVAVVAVRAVGVHALPAFVALPVPLVAGALVSAVWLIPRRVGAAWRALAATMVLVLVAAAGTVSFAHWYTGSRLVSGTTYGGPAAASQPAPTRPGRVAWRLTSPRPAVWQRAGYTVITHYDDEGGGEVHVYDSATGRERWHYRRGDAVLRVADLTDDTLDLQAIDMAGRGSLTGFELASGRRRWSRTVRPMWIHPAPAGLADSPLLYSAESAMPFEQPSFVRFESPSRGGTVSMLTADCTITEAVARSSTLVLNCRSAVDTSLIHAYRTGQHLWTIATSTSRYERVQLGTDVLAVPSPSAKPEWTFYRTSDGHRLWREHGAGRLFLTSDDRVVEQTARGELSVRDASTGRTLWSGDPRGLHLRPGGELDSVVTADGNLYAMWKHRQEHVSVITFDERSGTATGTTDLTNVIGDHCPANACAMQQLDAAGGGTVLITATYETRKDVVYALADGAGFTPR
jgi:outer membrane protein assembly factor BamB